MSDSEHTPEHGIVVYCTPFCGFCHAAKSLLHAKGTDFQEIDIFADPDRRQEMIARSGCKTVPQIFFGQRHIGGYDDLQALADSGELDALLAGLHACT
jgi:glutaredoxin 3